MLEEIGVTIFSGDLWFGYRNGGGKCCNPWITCNKETIFHGNEKKGGKGLIGLTPIKQISDQSPILKIGIHKTI